MFKLATEFPGFLVAPSDSRGNTSSDGDHLVGKTCSAHQTCPIYLLLDQKDLLPNMGAQLTRGKPAHLFSSACHFQALFIQLSRSSLACTLSWSGSCMDVEHIQGTLGTR